MHSFNKYPFKHHYDNHSRCLKVNFNIKITTWSLWFESILKEGVESRKISIQNLKGSCWKPWFMYNWKKSHSRSNFLCVLYRLDWIIFADIYKVSPQAHRIRQCRHTWQAPESLTSLKSNISLTIEHQI